MDNFQWTDELVKEFEIFYNKIDYAITGCDPIQKGIDQFKKSKEPKKEYEILEFITPYLGENDVIFKRTMDGDFSVLLNGFGDIVSEMSLSSNPVVRIHSVRRLSDGQIFTVGDRVYETITGKKDDWVIKEFSLKDTRCFSCGVNIFNIEKVQEPKPLLTEITALDVIEYLNETGENICAHGQKERMLAWKRYKTLKDAFNKSKL